MFKILMNILCVTSLYAIMLNSNFLDSRLGGANPDPNYFENFPCQKIPPFLDDYYIFRMSFHVFELIKTIIYERDRNDYIEYFLHHLLTAALIFFSYSINQLPVGATVMLLHDITDLTVSFFKVTIDVTHIAV